VCQITNKTNSGDPTFITNTSVGFTIANIGNLITKVTLVTSSISSGSKVITVSLYDATQATNYVGSLMTGTGIPPGTYVTSVNNGSYPYSITLSNSTTASIANNSILKLSSDTNIYRYYFEKGVWAKDVTPQNIYSYLVLDTQLFELGEYSVNRKLKSTETDKIDLGDLDDGVVVQSYDYTTNSIEFNYSGQIDHYSNITLDSSHRPNSNYLTYGVPVTKIEYNKDVYDVDYIAYNPGSARYKAYFLSLTPVQAVSSGTIATPYTNPYKDLSDNYNMIIETKYLDLSAVYNYKKLKRIYVMAKSYSDHAVDMYVTVRADAQTVLTPDHGHAVVNPDGSVTWVVDTTVSSVSQVVPNYQIFSDNLGQFILGSSSSNSSAELYTNKTSITGKCRRVKVRFQVGGGVQSELYGYGLEFKLKKP
jgi:hypothetical protein